MNKDIKQEALEAASKLTLHEMQELMDELSGKSTKKTPAMLMHILNVYDCVRNKGMDRLDAVRHVAKQSNDIEPNTVQAACTRNLNIDVYNFDSLLFRDLDLADLLIKRYSEHKELIESKILGKKYEA